MQKIYVGATTGVGSMLSMPATAQKVTIAMVVIGGLGLLILIAGLSWGVASGKQDIARTAEAVASAAAQAAKAGAVP